MSWWEVILVFVGIPSLLFAVITGVVVLFAEARVPDGLAAVRDSARLAEAGRSGQAGEGAPGGEPAGPRPPESPDVASGASEPGVLSEGEEE